MKRNKPKQIRIYDDFANEMAVKLIDKIGESNLGGIYREGGDDALRKAVTDEMEPIGAAASEITTVVLVLELELDGYRYLPPAGKKL